MQFIFHVNVTQTINTKLPYIKIISILSFTNTHTSNHKYSETVYNRIMHGFQCKHVSCP